MNPDLHIELGRNADACFFGNYPTLSDLDMVYGDGESSSWIINHLYSISEFCGCKEKLSDSQYAQLSKIISVEHKDMKISEFILFCYRFKSGKYGRFYGNVDPMIIVQAIERFSKDIKSEKIAISIEKEKCETNQSDENNMYYEDWCKLIGRDPNEKIEFKGFESSNTRKPVKKDENISDILKQARSVLSETNDNIRKFMEEYFVRKYKSKPSEYIKKYDRTN